MKQGNGRSQKKKRKKRRETQKTRQRQVMLAWRPLRSSDGPLRFRSHIGSWMELGIGLEDENGDIPCEAHSIMWAYRRKRSDKGSKVVCQIPALQGMRTQHPDVHLTHYDWFFVIDTNTAIFLNKSISVSCVLGGRAVNSPEHDSLSVDLSWVPVLHYEFWGQPGKPETFAWELLVRDLLNDPMSSHEDKVAIVVDAELGKLESINKRTACLANDLALPSNYYLIYASADANDFAINKIFRTCDKQARDFFNQVRSQYCQVGLPPVPEGTPFLRIWEFDDGIRNRILRHCNHRKATDESRVARRPLPPGSEGTGGAVL